jgi:hypothetical protein
MITLQPSPIELLEDRVSRLRHDKLLTFSTFCAQAAAKNVEVYFDAAKAGRSDIFDRLNSLFWQKLQAGAVDFPYDYEDLEDELSDLADSLMGYAIENGVLPLPNPVMARESVYLFIVTSSFFAGRGRIAQMLTVINNCISCKIDFYFRGELGIRMYETQAESLPAIYAFPVYRHALTDLEWVLTVLERDEGAWVSNDTLNMLQLYADNCPTFVVDRAFSSKG